MNRIRLWLRPGEPVHWHPNNGCPSETTDLIQNNWVVCRQCGAKFPVVVHPENDRGTREIALLVEPEIGEAWRPVAEEDLPVPQPYGDFS